VLLEAAQLKFLRHLLGVTKLDKEKNESIREKTGAQNIVKEIKQYQKKWLQHLQRMDTNRIPKLALQCRPKGTKLTPLVFLYSNVLFLKILHCIFHYKSHT